MKLGSLWARSRRSLQIDTRSSCSAVRRRGTNFAVTRLICKSSVRIFWHVSIATLTSSATSLIDVGQREWFLAHMPQSPRCGRWTACLGGGRLQRNGVHFWNGNTTQLSSIDLGRTLRKLLAAFRTFRRQISPDGNRIRCTHAAALYPPSWDATHTAGRRSLKGFHRAIAGRYRPPILHIHLQKIGTFVATSLRVVVSRGKKISPGIKWSAHVCVCVCIYIYIYVCVCVCVCVCARARARAPRLCINFTCSMCVELIIFVYFVHTGWEWIICQAEICCSCDV